MISLISLQACEPAARLALKDVNDKEDLLPGYHLNLHWNDSGVSPNKLFHLYTILVKKKWSISNDSQKVNGEKL